MFGGHRQLVALLGELGQLEMRAEVVGAPTNGFVPTLDGGGQRRVDVVKRLRRTGVPGLTQTVEDAPRLGLPVGFIAQIGELHGSVVVAGIDLEGLSELFASQVVLANL